jgi:hypothetical protein
MGDPNGRRYAVTAWLLIVFCFLIRMGDLWSLIENPYPAYPDSAFSILMGVETNRLIDHIVRDYLIVLPWFVLCLYFLTYGKNVQLAFKLSLVTVLFNFSGLILGVLAGRMYD